MKPGLSPGVRLSILVLIGWEALVALVLWRLGVIGWMLDYYRELLR